MNAVLIGSGNLATQLGKALHQQEIQILQVLSKTQRNADVLAKEVNAVHGAADQLAAICREADVYFICVSDQHIQTVIAGLPRDMKGLVVHTSGSTPIDVFDAYPGPHGVFYPVQTFSKHRPVSFSAVPVGIEASDRAAYEKLHALAFRLSEQVFSCDSVQRQAIHVAAVFACNFPNYLYSLAEGILNERGLTLDLIRPLMEETTNKALKYSPKTVQTGPAYRGDDPIVDAHLEFLARSTQIDPAVREIYERLSMLIRKSNPIHSK